MQSNFVRVMRSSLRVLVGGALVVGVVGCNSSTDSVIAPAATGSSFDSKPSQPNLAGTWSGSVLQEGSDAIPVTWSASQEGNSVSGTLVVSSSDMGEIHATLFGVISSTDEVAWVLNIEPGSIAAAPACAASGTGTSMTTATAISTNLDVFYATDCIGVVTTEPTERFQLSLSRPSGEQQL